MYKPTKLATQAKWEIKQALSFKINYIMVIILTWYNMSTFGLPLKRCVDNHKKNNIQEASGKDKSEVCLNDRSDDLVTSSRY